MTTKDAKLEAKHLRAEAERLLLRAEGLDGRRVVLVSDAVSITNHTSAIWGGLRAISRTTVTLDGATLRLLCGGL